MDHATQLKQTVARFYSHASVVFPRHGIGGKLNQRAITLSVSGDNNKYL